MGGLIILAATLIPTLLWAKLDNRYVLLAMVVMVWMGFIGFIDDYLKLKQRQAGKKNTGLIESYKLARPGHARLRARLVSSGSIRSRRCPAHRRRCRSTNTS